MTLSIFKWIGLALFTSILLTSSRRQTTLGSLSNNYSDLFTPDFFPNGTDLELPHGTMRYWQFGDKKGKHVVLIHGISTGSAIYDKMARDLASNGHLVLVYDLWGRGFSEAPSAKYDEALYTSQLAMLLQKVGWNQTDVIGVSLGGGIATSFTAFYPEMVNKLVLIAPTGTMDAKNMPFMFKAVNLPLVHQFVTSQPYIRPLLLEGIQRFTRSAASSAPQHQSTTSSLDPETQDAMNKLVKIATFQFLNHPGFLRAFLGTVIDFPFMGLVERYKKVGSLQKPVLVIWGDQDKTVPYYHNNALVQELIPQAKLVTYKEQAHDVMITNFRSVNKEVKSFLLDI